MVRCCWLFLLGAVVVGIKADDGEQEEVGFSHTFSGSNQKFIVRMHNIPRNWKKIGRPKGQSLTKMAWNNTLADVAKDRISDCAALLAFYKPKQEKFIPELANNVFGENNLVSMSKKKKMASKRLIKKAMKLWRKQAKKVTDYPSNPAWDCIYADGKNNHCREFGQMLWEATTQVGCAYETCPEEILLKKGNKRIKHTNFFLCHYFPKGNTGSKNNVIKPYE